MHMDLLFTSEVDRIAFCNFKANRRIKSLESRIDSYDEEIKDAIEKCGAIFDECGASENFIAELADIDSKFHSPSGVMYGSSEVESLNLEKENLLNRYNDFLAGLPLTRREDLEFLSGVLGKRRKMILDAADLIDALDREYPEARDFDVEGYLATQTVFSEIPKEDFKSEEVKLMPSSMPYVVHSGPAPDALLGYGTETAQVFEEIAPEETTHAEQDNSFFNDTEDSFGSLAGNDVIVPTFEEVKENPEEKTVTYTMATGDTLKLVATAVCGDENGWYDIYNANRELIDQRISENKVNPEAIFFEDDGDILTGLTLVIPKMYTKESQVTHRM